MQSDTLTETVHLTVFTIGLSAVVTRIEVFQNHPSTFEETGSIDQNAEHEY